MQIYFKTKSAECEAKFSVVLMKYMLSKFIWTFCSFINLFYWIELFIYGE